MEITQKDVRHCKYVDIKNRTFLSWGSAFSIVKGDSKSYQFGSELSVEHHNMFGLHSRHIDTNEHKRSRRNSLPIARLIETS